MSSSILYDALMMTEAEGRGLAGIPKTGDPRSDWRQERKNTHTNAIGVMDEFGRTLEGMYAEFDVFSSPNLKITVYLFTLYRKIKKGDKERVYQLEINLAKGIRPTEHRYSHEHYGEPSFKADESWASAGFQDAVKRFCTNTNLTLSSELPDYLSIQLR